MKATFFKAIFFIFIILLMCTSRQNDAENKSIEKLIPQENIKVKVPKFDAQSAKEFIAKQVSFGPRVTNSDGHQKCKEWLSKTFKSFEAKVIEQDFKATTYNNVQLNGTNIIARYNPNVQERIIIAAHWDTRPFADKDPDPLRQSDPILGADDGGSGVGVILELAQTLQKHPIPMGVDFILFDAEDYGDDNGNDAESWVLGSRHWAKHPHLKRQDVKYGILLIIIINMHLVT